ncbi:hypothetical protein JL09_g6592 [Pichia kudriavzevii]|uniref:Uncharacterized protein n=1 Tax=Pichia kudriavzevii TaxID=4909 RepID=A0A099NQ97_PICKU|nr:hypothetical protein JL09_g6592 [Pichia kudriavzevii]
MIIRQPASRCGSGSLVVLSSSTKHDGIKNNNNNN